MDEVRRVLDVDEPDYAQGRTLGPEAIPHLLALVQRGEPMLAAKAASLAGMIEADGSAEVLRRAAAHPDVTVRVAAAGAARNLPAPEASEVLAHLLIDRDPGVRVVALKSVPDDPAAELRAQVERLSEADRDSAVRALSTTTLRRIGG
jgi:HEAT repeat protein